MYVLGQGPGSANILVWGSVWGSIRGELRYLYMAKRVPVNVGSRKYNYRLGQDPESTSIYSGRVKGYNYIVWQGPGSTILFLGRAQGVQFHNRAGSKGTNIFAHTLRSANMLRWEPSKEYK
jgi:hypothetical protein